MTEQQLLKQDCFVHPSEYTFKDGTKARGMLSIYFPDEQLNFYFVPLANMNKFSQLMVRNNFSEMRKLCKKIELDDIVRSMKLA